MSETTRLKEGDTVRLTTVEDYQGTFTVKEGLAMTAIDGQMCLVVTVSPDDVEAFAQTFLNEEGQKQEYTDFEICIPPEHLTLVEPQAPDTRIGQFER